MIRHFKHYKRQCVM